MRFFIDQCEFKRDVHRAIDESYSVEFLDEHISRLIDAYEFPINKSNFIRYIVTFWTSSNVHRSHKIVDALPDRRLDPGAVASASITLGMLAFMAASGYVIWTTAS